MISKEETVMYTKRSNGTKKKKEKKRNSRFYDRCRLIPCNA